LGFISNFPPHTSLSSWEILRPHLVTPVLYLGPLYAIYLSRGFPGQKWWSWETNVRCGLCTWQATRNVFAVRILSATFITQSGTQAHDRHLQQKKSCSEGVCYLFFILLGCPEQNSYYCLR
jgi:hypothetical protein